ncbi:hypothetical protein ACLB2K_076476 [Fragaria x ananassa]
MNPYTASMEAKASQTVTREPHQEAATVRGTRQNIGGKIYVSTVVTEQPQEHSLFDESWPGMATSASLPVGFRFHPTEEELIDHYLKKKIKGHDFNDVIPEIDICSCEPWDLPGFSLIRSDDKEWFYFSRPDYKTKGNSRNRATERGFWKITGVDREIKALRSKALIGKKRTLTFYTGKVRNGQKTGWVIHEYYIPENLLPNAVRQRDFVLCRLKKKDESTDNEACGQGDICQTSTNNLSEFQNLEDNFGRPSIPEDLQITLQENNWPEESFAPPCPFHESPDYFASIESFLYPNAGSDDHLELQSALRHDDLEEVDYSLEDIPRTSLFNHSSEPTSTLRKVYDEGIHRQKKASSVNVAANLPRNIGHVRSVYIETLQAGSSSDKLSSALVTDKSYLNEIGCSKGGMVTGGAEFQSAQSDQGQIKQGFKPQEVKYTSLAPEKALDPDKPWRNDEQKGMKMKQIGATISDWKSSFIVWKESPLSLGSCPPVVYIRNMIGGLVLFIFFVGELISYGKW